MISVPSFKRAFYLNESASKHEQLCLCTTVPVVLDRSQWLDFNS